MSCTVEWYMYVMVHMYVVCTSMYYTVDSSMYVCMYDVLYMYDVCEASCM